jgi:Na+/H+ antiporter NhaB
MQLSKTKVLFKVFLGKSPEIQRLNKVLFHVVSKRRVYERSGNFQSSVQKGGEQAATQGMSLKIWCRKIN